MLRTLVDDDPGLARTTAALDRALARGQRWVGFLDDLCRFVSGGRCAADAGGGTSTATSISATKSRSRCDRFPLRAVTVLWNGGPSTFRWASQPMG